MPARCETCGIVIRWQPTIVDGKSYCCLGCAAGGPCECDYDHLPMPGDRVFLVVRSQRSVRVCDDGVSVSGDVQIIHVEMDEGE